MKKIVSLENIVDYLPILLGVITIAVLLHVGLVPNDKLFFLVLSLIGFYVAYGGLRGVRRQIKIATKKNDLDRHMGSVKLLCREEMTSQLGGVHGLRELLEPDSDGGKWIVEGARTSLETFLRENWDLDTVARLVKKEKKIKINMRKEVRDAIISALFSTHRKGERELDFSSLDLRLADLRGANLISTDLRSADLRSADLRKANLRNAKLRNTDLSCAASCEDLSYEDLGCADLSRADLSCADLYGANLTDAILTDAILTDANLTDAKLRGAKLRGAKLRGADLSYADLSYADFKEAKGLDKIGSYNGVFACRGEEPKGLSNMPEGFIEELRKNLR